MKISSRSSAKSKHSVEYHRCPFPALSALHAAARAHRGRVRSTSLDFNYTLGARIDGRWGKSTFREPSHMLCFSTRDYAGLILCAAFTE